MIPDDVTVNATADDTDDSTPVRRRYEKPRLTEHGSVGVQTEGRAGVLTDCLISLAEPC